MSYLGDAEVGEGVNIGAGAITANYDGTRKHPTTIGDGAFIGVDTMIVAPREIGEGARTGAGAVVTRDVPAGKLAVGVPARIREPRPETRAPTTPAGVSRRERRRCSSSAIIVVLVLLNGVFSATEIALVTLRRSRLQQLVDEGHGGAAPRPAPQAAAGPLPGGHPDRDQLPGLPGVGVRGGQPGRRAGRPGWRHSARSQEHRRRDRARSSSPAC